MKRFVMTIAALLVCSAFAVAVAAPPQTVQSQYTMSGILTEKDGKYLLTEDATYVTVEVQGKDLKKYVGEKVKLTGELITAANGVPQLLKLASINRVAGAAVGGKAAAAGVKAGLSKAAVVGIVGGAGAATAGTVYAVKKNNEDTPASRQ